MMVDAEATIGSIKDGMATLAAAIPEVMKGFGEVGKAVYRDGVLSARTKEMMAVASAIAARCEGCIAWHVRGAIRQGMTRAELEELAGVAVHMGGGPSLVYAIKALESFDQLAPRAAP
jgi:AhpD family alkylhydroperoxidase